MRQRRNARQTDVRGVAVQKLKSTTPCIASTHGLERRGRVGHLRGVVLDDLPAAARLLPVRKGGARLEPDSLAVRPVPAEHVGARVDREAVAEHAHGLRGVLHHPQAGHAGEEVLVSTRGVKTHAGVRVNTIELDSSTLRSLSNREKKGALRYGACEEFFRQFRWLLGPTIANTPQQTVGLARGEWKPTKPIDRLDQLTLLKRKVATQKAIAGGRPPSYEDGGDK